MWLRLFTRLLLGHPSRWIERVRLNGDGRDEHDQLETSSTQVFWGFEWLQASGHTPVCYAVDRGAHM
jgi:hypothetical protein